MKIKNEVLKNIEKFMYLLYFFHRLRGGINPMSKVYLIENFFNEMRKIDKHYEQKDFYQDMHYCKRQGYLDFKYSRKEGYSFSFTHKGMLKLMSKESFVKSKKWELVKGDTRLMVIFDIPEEKHHLRNRFRKILKIMNYDEIQKSVFVSKYYSYDDLMLVVKALGIEEYIRVGFFTEKTHK